MTETIWSPREATLYVTTKCHHKCKWCARQTMNLPAKPDMHPSVVQDLLRRYPGIQSVCIAGFGEPLLCIALPDILHELRDVKGVSIVTNGVDITRHIDLLVEHEVRISVSMNAASRKEHAEITKADTFDRVVDGVYAAIDAGLLDAISTVVGRSTLESLGVPLCDFARMCGARVDLHNVLPHGWHGFSSEVLREQDIPQIRAMVAQYRDVLRNAPEPLTSVNPHRCQSPLLMIGIDGNQAITPCRRVHGPDAARFGRLRDWCFAATEMVESVTGRSRACAECVECWGNWRY